MDIAFDLPLWIIGSGDAAGETGETFSPLGGSGKLLMSSDVLTVSKRDEDGAITGEISVELRDWVRLLGRQADVRPCIASSRCRDTGMAWPLIAVNAR